MKLKFDIKGMSLSAKLKKTKGAFRTSRITKGIVAASRMSVWARIKAASPTDVSVRKVLGKLSRMISGPTAVDETRIGAVIPVKRTERKDAGATKVKSSTRLTGRKKGSYRASKLNPRDPIPDPPPNPRKKGK